MELDGNSAAAERDRDAAPTRAREKCGADWEACANSLANAQHPTEAAEMLLDRVPEATAVFAIADLFALALMEEARKRGLVVR